MGESSKVQRATFDGMKLLLAIKMSSMISQTCQHLIDRLKPQ
jgi:hypothetical protein